MTDDKNPRLVRGISIEKNLSIGLAPREDATASACLLNCSNAVCNGWMTKGNEKIIELITSPVKLKTRVEPVIFFHNWPMNPLGLSVISK